MFIPGSIEAIPAWFAYGPLGDVSRFKPEHGVVQARKRLPAKHHRTAGTYKTVTGGSLHNCAIKSDDTIACWGNSYPQQVDVSTGTYKALDAGWYHNCAIAPDDTIACWSPWQALEGVRWVSART